MSYPMPPTATITEEICVDVPNVATPVRTAKADPRREYIAAGGFLWLPALLKSLPLWIDDISRDFGRDIWERMLWDPALQSSTRLLREAATSAALVCPPTVDGEVVGKDHPEFAQADTIATFCKRNLRRVRPGYQDVLYELSEAVTDGHALAEQVYETATLDPAAGPQLCLKTLKVKAPETYAFVVDPYNNTPGVVYAAPGQPLVGGNTVLTDKDGNLAHFLPRAKYALYTHWPHHGDPRGRSILRAAYRAWFFKGQVWVEYLRYLATFASAMLWGTVAPNSLPAEDGTTPEAAMLTALQGLRNGAVGVGPDGSTLTAVQVQGEGRAFTSALDEANHEMTMAVLMATRATMEAEHGSRADSGTAQDVVELGVQSLRGDLADVTAYDVLAPLVIYNYGPDALRYLPAVSLGTTERHDFAAEATALASLAGTPVVHWSMLPALRTAFNLPPADEAAEASDRTQKQALAEQLAQRPVAPPADGNAPAAIDKPGPPPAKETPA